MAAYSPSARIRNSCAWILSHPRIRHDSKLIKNAAVASYGPTSPSSVANSGSGCHARAPRSPSKNGLVFGETLTYVAGMIAFLGEFSGHPARGHDLRPLGPEVHPLTSTMEVIERKVVGGVDGTRTRGLRVTGINLYS